MKITFHRITLHKRHPLRISRGISTGSDNLFVRVEKDGIAGVGELAGTNAPGGETCDSGEEELTRLVDAGIDGLAIADIWRKGRELGVRPRALAALDVALWDQLGRTAGLPLWRIFGLSSTCVPTSVTIGINPPDVVRERVPEILSRTGGRFLKVKLGAKDGIDADKESFLAAVAAAEPFGVGIRVDANGGWALEDARHMLAWLAERQVEYVEQPLPRGAEDALPELFAARPLPIFVDESCDVSADVPALADRVDGVNVKLMKCGGLTEALRLVATARAHGLGTMIGCMGESSVAISAGAAIGSLFDYIDLDSHLNLLDDPAVGAQLIAGVVTPNTRPGHGATLTDVEA